MGRVHRASALVRKPVLFRDIRLGVVADALFDRAVRRLVGLEVACPDRVERFLPFPACAVEAEAIRIDSSLVLLERNVDFYRLGGCTFADLAGGPVLEGGSEAGPLADLLVTDDGEVTAVAVATQDGERELAAGPGVSVGNQGLRPAV